MDICKINFFHNHIFLTFATFFKTNNHGKKFKLNIQVENGKSWTFEGTTTHVDRRLVIIQIFKKIIKELFRRDDDASYREIKELTPIKNKIDRLENAFDKKRK